MENYHFIVLLIKLWKSRNEGVYWECFKTLEELYKYLENEHFIYKTEIEEGDNRSTIGGFIKTNKILTISKCICKEI